MSELGGGRGIGIADLFRTSGDVPVVLSGLFTQLGDVWLLLLVAGVVYVAGDDRPGLRVDRRSGLFVLALVVTYVALIVVLKEAFLLPRPPGASDPPGVGWLQPAVELSLTTAEGSGFPSGHALGSTMVWGGLALVLDRGARRTRFGFAGAVVAGVALSRLVLGVHYLVDVVAGVALGVVALGALYWLSRGGNSPGRVFLIAAVIGGVGLIQGITPDSAAAAGGAVGGLLAWRGVVDVTPPGPTNTRAVVASVAVLVAAGGVFGLTYASPFPLPSRLSPFLGAAVAVGGAVGAPALGERMAQSSRSDR
jgi:membrane-associated phospholipid phosphatase